MINNFISYGLFFNYLFVYLHLNTIFFLSLNLINASKIRTVSDLKYFKKIPLLFSSILFLFFSFAGLPPFLGFFGKFFIFWLNFLYENYFFIFLLAWLNFYLGYFYVQNIRFFFNNYKFSSYTIKNNRFYLNTYLLYFLFILTFINVFGFVFFIDYLNLGYYIALLI